MKFDVGNLRFLTKDDFRVLAAIELGMRNHEYVPVDLISSLAELRHGGIHKIMSTLARYRLVKRERKFYEGYRLTYGGYDYLALRTMLRRGTIAGVGRRIGVGKESDVYLAVNDEGEEMALKLQRLGRTSFRNIRNKRDYLAGRRHTNWLHLSRLAAAKEFAFMTALHKAGFPVPKPIDCSRHAVLMSKVAAHPMTRVRHIEHPGAVYDSLMSILVRLARHGLIHGDFNEFNLMISDDETVTFIDFPQMVSTRHPNAKFYFDRDVQGIVSYFEKKYGFVSAEYPKLQDFLERERDLDEEVEASGFSEDQEGQLQRLLEEDRAAAAAAGVDIDAADGNGIDEDDEDEDDEGEEGEEERGAGGAEDGGEAAGAAEARAGNAAAAGGVSVVTVGAEVLQDEHVPVGSDPPVVAVPAPVDSDLGFSISLRPSWTWSGDGGKLDYLASHTGDESNAAASGDGRGEGEEEEEEEEEEAAATGAALEDPDRIPDNFRRPLAGKRSKRGRGVKKTGGHRGGGGRVEAAEVRQKVKRSMAKGQRAGHTKRLPSSQRAKAKQRRQVERDTRDA